VNPLELDRIKDMAGVFDSVDIVVSSHLPCRKEWIQIRFPKSRRKRIRKKWAKDKRRNWSYEDTEPVYMHLNGQILTNRLGYERIKKGLVTGTVEPSRSST